MFTPQQEVDLGDIEAEQVERTARVIHDDALSAYLNHIVDRILAQLPPTHLQFHVMLIDQPVVNAFTLPGGRIYVTRKMVAFARDDDELADLLSHEMGHALSHQGAIDMTRLFRELLGVTSVGDRKDISEKFNRMLDNMARNPAVLQRMRSEEAPNQYQADQVALYALADAGYSPPTFADFFDRTAQTKGKSGGFLSDVFGTTTPNEKRLREIRRNIDALPATCREQPATPASQEFLSWQADVIAYSGLGRQEILSGVLDKKTLDPPLRNDVTNIKFSPDGRYVLAQDDSSVFVLSRDPLHLLFRIDAPDSHAAQFTPDSQNVVFDTRGMRVEEWSISDEERTSVHELAFPAGCAQVLLSPDGKTFACVDSNFSISLYDVAQGNSIFSKKGYFSPGEDHASGFFWTMLMSIAQGAEFQWVHMAFSQDAKTFLGASLSASLAVDVTTHNQISLHGALSDMIKGGFAFLAPDQVIALNRFDPKNSAILKFPSGEVTKRLLLGGERWSAASHGDHLMVGPLKGDVPTGVLDLSSTKIVFASKDNYAVDAYDQTVAIQLKNGEIGLFDTAANKLQAHTAISLSPLGRLRAEAVSKDLKWVALSGNTRGAVWNISTAQRLYYTRSFHGAYFDRDLALFADYPKFQTQDRSMVRLDVNGRDIKTLAPIDDQSAVRQWGPFLVTRKAAGKQQGLFWDTSLEVSDVHGGNPLWSRTFPKEFPSLTLDASAGTLLLSWQVDTDAAKNELKSHPVLQARLAAIHDRKNAWVLEDLDARTGIEMGALIVDTGKGSFSVERASAVGDWVIIADSQGRTLIYSLSSGEQKAAFFGTQSILPPDVSMLAIEREPGRIDIYGVPSFEKRGQLVFSSPVALWRFSDDSKRLFVLTKDQTAYTFDPLLITLPETAAPISASSLTQ
jgi:hypothetical protein